MHERSRGTSVHVPQLGLLLIMARCRDCGHTIVFVLMRKTGKLCPVAPIPDDQGTIIARPGIRAGRGPRYVDGIVRHYEIALEPDQVRLIVHRAVCPHPKHLPKARPVPEVTPQPVLI